MRVYLFALIAASLAACSSGTRTASEDCGDAGPCPAGAVCVDDACRTICRVASDCPEPCSSSNPDGDSCVNDVCVTGAGCADGSPVITAIDGVGLTNSGAAPGVAEHFAGSGVRITGAGLTGASAYLGTVELAVESSSDGELIACLPDGTSAGVHSVTVANQAGATCGDFELVQGSPGPPGTYTGPEIVSLVGDGFDDRYVHVDGDAMTGELSVAGSLAVGHSSPAADFLVRGLLGTSVTGTVTITASSAEVLGAGTSFDTELSPGDALLIDGNTYEVASIADATHLTLAGVASSSAAGVSATRDRNLMKVQTGAAVDVLRVSRTGTVNVLRALNVGIELVTASCTGYNCNAYATCPAGKQLLSGGCAFVTCDKSGSDRNHPDTDLVRWRCASNQCTSTTSYALCARIQ